VMDLLKPRRCSGVGIVIKWFLVISSLNQSSLLLLDLLPWSPLRWGGIGGRWTSRQNNSMAHSVGCTDSTQGIELRPIVIFQRETTPRAKKKNFLAEQMWFICYGWQLILYSVIHSPSYCL
jgi:hypothetical protein